MLFAATVCLSLLYLFFGVRNSRNRYFEYVCSSDRIRRQLDLARAFVRAIDYSHEQCVIKDNQEKVNWKKEGF